MVGIVVFRNGAPFDGVSAERREGVSVVVEGNRIREVSDRPVAVSGAALIDLADPLRSIPLVMKDGAVHRNRLGMRAASARTTLAMAAPAG